jgi:hypothetical protein
VAALLDFQAGTNAVWDHKPLCAAEYQAQRHRLEQVGLASWITEYLGRLGELESRRPSVGGDARRFGDVRAYRESVARLSLATITAIALNAESVDEGIRATHADGDVATLFRMAMQCQIIDDVLDYRRDLSAGLPSFLTACASLPQSAALTAGAAQYYRVSPEPRSSRIAFSLRIALGVLSAVAMLAVRAAAVRTVPWPTRLGQARSR